MIDYRKLYSKYDKEDLINTCINLKEYKERLRKEVNKSYMICNEKDKEIERLNNIINELEKWLVEWREMLDYPDFYEEGIIDCINDTLTKLQELKGKNKFNIINKPTFTTSSTSGNRPLPPKQTKGSDK